VGNSGRSRLSWDLLPVDNRDPAEIRVLTAESIPP